MTRFEKGNQSKSELDFMERGIIELRKYNIDVMNIYNNDNLEENVEKVVSYVVNNWKKKKKNLFYLTLLYFGISQKRKNSIYHHWD